MIAGGRTTGIAFHNLFRRAAIAGADAAAIAAGAFR
jgi:hypothetical protein